MDVTNLQFPSAAARAYGVAMPKTSPALRAQAANSTPDTARDSARDPANDARVRSLVAARVPGRVDFDAPAPHRSAGTLQMYRHPADKNAAAVAVDLGTRLDVRG